MNTIFNFFISMAVYTIETFSLLLIVHGIIQKKLKLEKTIVLFLLLADILWAFSTYIYAEFLIDATQWVSYVLIFGYVYYIVKKGAEKALQIMMASVMIIFLMELVIVIVFSAIGQKYIDMLTLQSHLMQVPGVIITLIACYVLYKKGDLLKVFYYVFEKNRILGRMIAVAGILCISGVFVYKIKSVLSNTEVFFFCSFGVLFTVALVQWKKAMDLSQEKDKRIRIQKMCQESYEQLILEVRNRQHEFQNHLSALQGMCYSCQTIEELSELQSKYCDRILVENKYNKLLYICKSPIVGGFLYSKFSKAGEQGITTEYQVDIDFKEQKMDEFELIEMLGILYDNAVEAIASQEEKTIVVKVVQEGEELRISVENVAPFLSSQEIASFFQQGFSTKGKGRGLGLAKLQKMAEKHKGRIVTQNVEREGTNWILINLLLKLV